MEDLHNIIKELKKYEEINPSDDQILKSATEIFISNNINNRKIDVKEHEEPATDKQLWVLKQAKVKIPKDLSKRGAIQMIKELRAKENEN